MALVPRGARVADVGSDHGRLPLHLLARGIASFAIATEKTPTRAARIGPPTVGAPWSGALDRRSGDGLEPLAPADAIDVLIVAGVGGRTILRMLDVDALDAIAPKTLVLQPRTEIARVRAWLSRRGFRLVRETLTRESGRRHVTLAAERGGDADLYRDGRLSREDLLVAGPHLVRSGDPEVTAAWREERSRLVAIAAASGETGRGASPAARELARCERILAAAEAAGSVTSPSAG